MQLEGRHYQRGGGRPDGRVVRDQLAEQLHADTDRGKSERADAAKKGLATTKIDSRLSETRSELAAVQSVRNAKAGKVSTSAIQVSNDMPAWLKDAAGKASANPDLLFYKLKTNAYKFSWALIPISVPFVWLLFAWSRRFKLYDHTVFVTYSLCFMMILLTVGTVILSRFAISLYGQPCVTNSSTSRSRGESGSLAAAVGAGF